MHMTSYIIHDFVYNDSFILDAKSYRVSHNSIMLSSCLSYILPVVDVMTNKLYCFDG